MKIYSSTQYVRPEERDPYWYALDVISMFDLSTKAICYDCVRGTYIDYRLLKNTPIDENSYKSETVFQLTKDMEDEIINMGYTLIKNKL